MLVSPWLLTLVAAMILFRIWAAAFGVHTRFAAWRDRTFASDDFGDRLGRFFIGRPVLLGLILGPLLLVVFARSSWLYPYKETKVIQGHLQLESREYDQWFSPTYTFVDGTEKELSHPGDEAVLFVNDSRQTLEYWAIRYEMAADSSATPYLDLLAEIPPTATHVTRGGIDAFCSEAQLEAWLQENYDYGETVYCLIWKTL